MLIWLVVQVSFLPSQSGHPPLELENDPVSVYKGKFLIGGIIEIPGSLESKEYEVTLELHYQACNDVTCQPPKSIKVHLSFPVVEDDVQANRIHHDIFSQIKFERDKKQDFRLGRGRSLK